MKKVTVFLVSLLFTSLAFAGFQAFENSTDLKTFNKLKCDEGLTCSKVGDKLDIDLNGIQERVTASTTALTAAQCGSSVISTGAAVQPLPEASTVLGCRYTFICGTADDFDIDPADATDVIGVINAVAAGTGSAITPSAGDEIRCTDIGSSIVLEATSANLWTAVGVANGAWTDVN